MIATVLLSSFLAAQTVPSRIPAFQPRLNIRFQPPHARLVLRSQAAPEIVCGMPMIRKSADDDPKILLPSRDTGAAIRRIEPEGCGATPSRVVVNR
jgi:hypothetical protein